MHMRKDRYVNHHVLAVCYYSTSYQALTSVKDCAGKSARELNLQGNAGYSPNLKPEPRIQLNVTELQMHPCCFPPQSFRRVLHTLRSDICLHIFNSVNLALR